MNTEHVRPVTDHDFEEVVLRSPTPVLVDFGATWCPPCRAMDPHVAALAGAYAGRVRVVTCDIDDSPDAAIRFGIRSAPTFLVVRDGVVVDRLVGAVPRGRLEALMQRGLA